MRENVEAGFGFGFEYDRLAARSAFFDGFYGAAGDTGEY